MKSSDLIGTIRGNIDSPRLKDTDKETLYSELLSLLSSGLDFSNSFNLLISGEENGKTKKLLTVIFDKMVSRFILAMPVGGDIVRKNQQAQFCKLLYLLTASGVPLLKGLGMLTDIITFYPYNRSLGKMSSGIEKGELLSENLAAFPDLYESKLVTLLRVGEETNKLPGMLQK